MKAVKFRAAACLLAIALLASACSSSSGGSSKNRTIRYGISGDLAIYWHVYVGEQMGMFAKHHVTVKKVTTRTGSATDLLALLLGGQVDVADVLPDPVLAASANTSKLSVLNYTGAGAYRLVARKGITSFDQLKSLAKIKVAVSSPTTAIAGLSRLIFEQQGISPDKLQLIVTGGTSARLAAIQSGSVDVGLLVQPADFKAQSNGLSILSDSVGQAPWYGLTDVVQSSKVKQNCSLYKDFFAALADVHTFLVDPANKTKAIDILVKGTGATQSDAAKTYDLFLKDNAMPGINDPTKTLQETSKMLKDLGTKSAADPAKLVNTSCSS